MRLEIELQLHKLLAFVFRLRQVTCHLSHGFIRFRQFRLNFTETLFVLVEWKREYFRFVNLYLYFVQFFWADQLLLEHFNLTSQLC